MAAEAPESISQELPKMGTPGVDIYGGIYAPACDIDDEKHEHPNHGFVKISGL